MLGVTSCASIFRYVVDPNVFGQESEGEGNDPTMIDVCFALNDVNESHT